jgi:hypothetical protein
VPKRCGERESGVGAERDAAQRVTGSAAAVTQYWKGGFSKYLRPFRRGVTQSPVAAISRAISA